MSRSRSRPRIEAEPLVGLNECRENAEERGLAAAVWTEQAKNLARSDAKRDIVEREAIAVAMSQTTGRERGDRIFGGLHGRDDSGNARSGENPVEPRIGLAAARCFSHGRLDQDPPSRSVPLRQIAFAGAENRTTASIRFLRRFFFLLRAASGIFPRCQVADFVGGFPAGRYCGFDRHIRCPSLLLESQSGNPVCPE